MLPSRGENGRWGTHDGTWVHGIARCCFCMLWRGWSRCGELEFQTLACCLRRLGSAAETSRLSFSPTTLSRRPLDSALSRMRIVFPMHVLQGSAAEEGMEEDEPITYICNLPLPTRRDDLLQLGRLAPVRCRGGGWAEE